MISEIERETLARYFHAYMEAFLNARRNRSRFGFEDPFCDTASAVACIETARLLRPTHEPAVSGFRLDELHRRLTAAQTLAGRDDDSILDSIRRLLRVRAEHGLIAQWKAQNPHDARLLRQIKRRIAACGRVTVRREPRGLILAAPGSDPCRPPVPDVELEHLFSVGHQDIDRALDRLPELLRPTELSGGWCFLMDAVHAAARAYWHAMETSPESTGTTPARAHPPAGPDGLPHKLWQTRIRHTIRVLARAKLQEDQHKASRRDARRHGEPGGGAFRPSRPEAARVSDPNLIDAYVETCVEMICRNFGMGNPAWEGLPQRDVFSQLAPAEADPHGDHHRDRLNYLVRRVRESWRAHAMRIGAT